MSHDAIFSHNIEHFKVEQGAKVVGPATACRKKSGRTQCDRSMAYERSTDNHACVTLTQVRVLKIEWLSQQIVHALTDEERGVLMRISRSASEPASHVARAKALLAAANGRTYQDAAETAGRHAGDMVVHLVSRFNREGLASIAPCHCGSAQPILCFYLLGSSVVVVVHTPHLASSNPA